jgi:hypothetical protein
MIPQNEYESPQPVAEAESLVGVAMHGLLAVGEIVQLNPETCRNPMFAVSGTELDVCRDIESRQQMGIRKYGMTVATNPAHLREWLQHAYQESLDKAIYLKRAIAELDSANAKGDSQSPDQKS